LSDLSERHRAALRTLCAVLIPERKPMPAANQIDVAGVGMDRVLESRPDLGPELARIVDMLDGDEPEAALALLERERPEDMLTLLSAVAGAYYIDPEVRRQLGYPGQEALTLDVYRDLTAYIEEGLLEPVIARGPIYRTVESDSSVSPPPQ
jgi:hypothetical protein